MTRFTKRDALLWKLIAAGPDGLSRDEIIRTNLVPARRIDQRMDELRRDHRIKADPGPIGRTRLRRGETAKPFRWIYLGPRTPLVADTPYAQPSLLPEDAGVAPSCALIGGES